MFVYMLSMLAFANPSGDCLNVRNKSREERAAEIEAAEKEFAAKAPKEARVLVLKWPKTTTSYTDPALQLTVQSAINRTDVKLLPVMDLYQGGRFVPHIAAKPEEQKGRVPDTAIDSVLFHVQDAARIRYEDISPDDWKIKAEQLHKVADLIWFVDRIELRKPLVMLYSEIGRAADNVEGGQLTAPFFQSVGGRQVNYYWYLAAQFVAQDDGLLDDIPDDISRESIQGYANDIRSFSTMKLDFQVEEVFKKEDFDKEYEVLLNGMPVDVNEQGQVEILLGITDIFVRHREGGYGLADRYEARTDDRAYSVLDDARKSLTTDLIDQLFKYENECKPQIKDDVLSHFATYSLLHPSVAGETYIAVPKNGNPHQVWIWRYDPKTHSLSRVANGSTDFPINFVASLNVGAVYSGVSAQFSPPTSGDVQDAINLDAIPASVPVGFELRLHYTRFMANFGVEFSYNAAGSGWTEIYPSPEDKSNALTMVGGEKVTHSVDFNRTTFLGLGYLFGRDAITGLGPRAGLRVGWSDLPNAVATTGHFGWAIPAPKIERFNKRTQLIVDADFRAGFTFGLEPSLLIDEETSPSFTFGLTVGAGSTF